MMAKIAPRFASCVCALYFCSITTAQEHNNSKKEHPTLSIAIAPTLISIIGQKPDQFCLTNFYATLNFRVKNRFSISTGFQGFQKKNVKDYFTNENKNYNVIGYLLKFNYNINKPNNKINLYVTIGLAGSRIFFNGNEERNLSLGFGGGLDFKITERISFLIEPSRNYFHRDLIIKYGLTDCQIGFKFKL